MCETTKKVFCPYYNNKTILLYSVHFVNIVKDHVSFVSCLYSIVTEFINVVSNLST